MLSAHVENAHTAHCTVFTLDSASQSSNGVKIKHQGS